MYTCIKTVGEKFFQHAATEEKDNTSQQNGNTSTTRLKISGDVTWKKRGFTFLYGVTSLIGYYTG